MVAVVFVFVNLLSWCYTPTFTSYLFNNCTDQFIYETRVISIIGLPITKYSWHLHIFVSKLMYYHCYLGYLLYFFIGLPSLVLIIAGANVVDKTNFESVDFFQL